MKTFFGINFYVHICVLCIKSEIPLLNATGFYQDLLYIKIQNYSLRVMSTLVELKSNAQFKMR